MENTAVKNPNKKWNLSLLGLTLLALVVEWGIWDMMESMKNTKIDKERQAENRLADMERAINLHGQWIQQVAPVQHTHSRPETNNTAK